MTKAARAALFAMFSGRCAYCGSVLPEKGWHADHVLAVQRKSDVVLDPKTHRYKYVHTGEHWAPENDRHDNLMPSCAPCNIHKATTPLEEWRGVLERSTEILRDNYSVFRHAERFGLVKQVGEKVTFYFETFATEKSA